MGCKKIFFVHEEFGRISEVFLHRINTSMQTFEVELLTGSYINHELFPFDSKKIQIWDYRKVNNYQKIIPFINRKFKRPGRQSGLHEVIISFINESDADLICFQFAFFPIKIGKDLAKIKKKTCLIQHGTDLNRAIEDREYRQRLIEVWKHMDKIFFVSQFLKKVAVSLGCPESKVVVNYLGVPKITLKQPITRNDNVSRFICVARMVPVKNHINLIHAFSKLIKQTNKKVELVLIGTGILEGEIKDLIRSLGIEKNVIVHGALSNEKTLEQIAISDVFILVSKIYIEKGKMRQEEGLPISLLEGAALGLPLIGAKTGGIPEVVQPETNGYLVDPLNIDDIANAMLSMVQNPQKTKEMGEKAKQLIELKFNIKKQMRKLERHFLNIIEADKR